MNTFLKLLTFCILTAAICTIGNIMNRPWICIEESTIESIGGCNEYAACGVKYSNGSFGTVSYPVVGQRICIKKAQQK